MKVARDSGASGMDERGKSEMGTGWRPTFVLNEIGSVARSGRGKKGWSTWAHPRGGGRRRERGPA
jgi:hypothetical protein